MLSITSRAAGVLGAVREQQGVPAGYVVRVFASPRPNGLEVQISFAPAPTQGDQVVEAEGTTLCVDPDLAEPLADTVNRR